MIYRHNVAETVTEFHRVRVYLGAVSDRTNAPKYDLYCPSHHWNNRSEKTREAYTCTVVSHEAQGEWKVSLRSRRIISHRSGVFVGGSKVLYCTHKHITAWVESVKDVAPTI